MNDIKSITDRLRNAQAALRKQAADDGGVADPNERGSTTPKDDPKYGPANASVPNMVNSATTGNGSTGQTNLQEPLKPSQVGTNVPSTDRQEPKDDAATQPDTPIGKIAASAQRIRALLGKEAPPAAPAEPAKQAGDKQDTPPASGWDPAVRQKMAEALGIDEAALETMSQEQFAEHTRDRLCKIATLVLEAEGGVETITELLEKHAGAMEARAIIGEAVNSYAAMSKIASEDIAAAQEQANQAEAMRQEAMASFAELTKDATEADTIAMREYGQAIEKAAAMFLQGPDADPEAFRNFLIGMKQAAADVAALEAGNAPMGMEPEGDEVPQEGGDEAMNAEALIMALEEALQTGQITPEQAAQLMDELQAGGAATDTPEAVVEEDMKAAAAALGI